MAEPTFEELLASAQRRALHLELRDGYEGCSPAFAPWLAGEPIDEAEEDAEWHSLIRPLVAKGVDVRRARVISEPVSDYIRFEYEGTPKSNLAAGEKVRWLPRRQASEVALPGNDFWIFDDTLSWNHFSGAGDWVGTEVTTDPEILKFCAASFEAVWERAIPHENYRPT